MKFNFKKNLPHLIAIVAILLINVVYFIPQFQGKTLEMGDVVAFESAAKEIQDFRSENDKEALWTNSMFGGMPSFSISLKSKNNIVRPIGNVLRMGMARPAGYFILGMISMYLCLILLGVNSWISLIMSIIFSLSTSNLMLLSAGHATKVQSIMVAAPIIAGALLVMKGRRWLGLAVFTLFLALNVMSNHPQMTFYMGIVMVIFMIFFLIEAIQNKKILEFAKGAGFLLAGCIIAIGISASVLMPTYEYGKHTMRGQPILTNDASGPTSSSHVDGLDWDYAMGWSGGSLDVLSIFIPYAAGGATVEKLPKNSKFAKITNQRKEVSAYTYFGSLPSTAGPYYFGAIVFFLFVFGGFVVKGKLKWWLVTGVILTLLMSMGKNFEILNRMMFDYVPLLNKFRTPNSVMSITGILLVVLAGLGLNQIVKDDDRKQYIKPLFIALGAVAGFSILFALIGPSMISFEGAYDSRMGADQKILDALYSDRAGMLSSSAWRTAIFVLLSGLALYGFLKSKINKPIMLTIIGLLAIADQILVSKNYFGANFVSVKKYESKFVPRPADKQILTDTDPHYRVQDFTVDTYNTSSTSYFHKTVGGYSAAKLQRFEDIRTRHLANRTQQNPYGNQAVLNMLNTKYFIVPTGENTSAAQRNPAAAGNAWFVNDVKYVPNANAEIAALNDFDPLTTAVVHEEFKGDLNGLSLNKSGEISLTNYSPIELKYSSNSTSDQLAVFSEVWYGPNLGWQAYIDDKPVEHIRVNYLLRGLVIPAGQHNVRFEFSPASYKTGGMISLISSILLFILLGFAGYKLWKGQEGTELE